jgi:hypothetical protein
MDKFKAGLKDVRILVYLDDIIVLLSSDFESHMSDRKQQFNLRMNRHKCRFACNEVKYLGHIISANGIQVRPDKVTAVTSRPAPKNVKQLLTFWQTCNKYPRFIPGFANLARPLTELTKRDAVWKWDISDRGF